MVVVMGGRVVYTVAVSDLFEFEDFLDEAALHLGEASSVTEVGACDHVIFTKLASVADEILAVGVAQHKPIERRGAGSSAGVHKVHVKSKLCVAC